MAIDILSRSQVYAPGPETTLWNWCIPKMNQLVNAGKLSSLERSRSASRSKARAKTPGTKKVAAAPISSPPQSPIRKFPPLPGQKRGGKGGRGRGGAIPVAVKMAVRDLVVNCNVPMRDVPKVWATVYTGLFSEAPDPNTLFCKSHISDWIVDLSGAELLGDITDFWACKAEYPDLQFHVHHDATARKTFEVGRDAKLMAYLLSYFNPKLNRAVYFILSLRALPGSGSAAATARGLAVNLADMGACVCKSSTAADEAFQVELLAKGKGVLADVGSDNTDSAINVAAEISKLTKETHESYPCPTHINALDGKTPLEAAFGRRAATPTVASYDQPNVLNVPAKVFYIWSKHRAMWKAYWHQLKLKPDINELMAPPDGQPGKWDTMGPAFRYVVTHAPELRKLMVKLEFMTTNTDGHGSLHKDAGLLWRWLCDPELFFAVLSADAWFNREIEPVYTFLRTPSHLFPESGPHFKRHEMPWLALQKLHTCRTFSGDNVHWRNVTWTAAKAEAVAKKQIPEAYKMLADAAPRDEGVGAGRFVVKPDEKDELLLQWATGYSESLSTNWDKHWSKFLEPPLLFGLATDPELGAAFVRRLIGIFAPTYSARAGSASALSLSATPASLTRSVSAAQLDKYVCELMLGGPTKAKINASISKLKLGTDACLADWLKLADPTQRKDVDWTRATLPALAPFFQNKFFGGFHAQLVLEQIFSVYGQHINPEQSMPMKEAVVASNVRLGPERAERMAEEMRAKPLTDETRAKLQPAQQRTGELTANDENRKQLELMCEQMLKRMRAVTSADVKEGDSFGKKRAASWEKLRMREEKAMVGGQVAKRQKGTAQMTTDAFTSVRGEKRKQREAAYEKKAAEAASPPPPSPPVGDRMKKK